MNRLKIIRPFLIAGLLLSLVTAIGFPLQGQTAAPATDTIQYVAPGGSDSNDGLSWSAPKADIAAAQASLPSCQWGNHCGTIYVASGTYTLTSELDIGDSSGSPVVVDLIGPMSVNMEVSGSSQCAVKQWPNSVVNGPTDGHGGLTGRVVFQSVAGYSPYSFYCTASTLGVPRGYYAIKGIAFYNAAGVVTASGYAAIFAGMYDVSSVEAVFVDDHTNNAAWVWWDCCGTTFNNDAFWGAGTGKVNLTVGPGLDATGTHQDMGVNFVGTSIVRSAPGYSDLVIQEPRNSGGSLNFYGTYIEGDRSPHTVPFIDIQSAVYGVSFYGLQVEGVVTETVDAIHIGNHGQSRVLVHGMTFVGRDNNAIQDNRNGQTVRLTSPVVPDYTDLNGKGGIIASFGADGISAGTITLSSGYGSHTFLRPYSKAPVCTATDTTSAAAVQVKSSTTAVTVIANVNVFLAGTTGTGAVNGSDVIAWTCMPATN